jgi:murein DD-endopeptidase MepM/ murein hydrolase activator NlpD
MKRGDLEMLLLLVGGLFVLSRRRVDFGDGWVWPVPRISVRGRIYEPVITSNFSDMRGGEPHGGLDIVFARKNAADLVDLYPPGTPNGGKSWFAPPHVPILAARAGRVWSVEQTKRGWQVILDHAQPFSSFYTHLETPSPVIKPGMHVKAGDVLGFMGWDPTDPERVRHLHFAVRHGPAGSHEPVDSQQAMRSWPHANMITTIA